jgi:hypothetical protein
MHYDAELLSLAAAALILLVSATALRRSVVN